MSIIGITKNKHVDNSHNGIPGGLSNMAQNAESYMVELSVIRTCLQLLLVFVIP